MVTACTLSAGRQIHTVGLLASDFDSTEASEADNQARNMTLVLLERERPLAKFAAGTTASAWVLDIFHGDIQENMPDHQAA